MDITIPGQGQPEHNYEKYKVDSMLADLVGGFKERTETMEASQQQENAALKANIDNLGSMMGQIAAAVKQLSVQPPTGPAIAPEQAPSGGFHSPNQIPLPDGHPSNGGVL
jgi:hypothetical protein